MERVGSEGGGMREGGGGWGRDGTEDEREEERRGGADSRGSEGSRGMVVSKIWIGRVT